MHRLINYKKVAMTYNNEQFGSADIFAIQPPDGEFRFLQITAAKQC